MNPTPFLNRAAVKSFALETAKTIRPANGFCRVGTPFLIRINAAARVAIENEVRRHPSKGVTLL